MTGRRARTDSGRDAAAVQLEGLAGHPRCLVGKHILAEQRAERGKPLVDRGEPRLAGGVEPGAIRDEPAEPRDLAAVPAELAALLLEEEAQSEDPERRAAAILSS